MAEDELAACKLSITQALQGVPEHAHVGLVTFGTHVHAYELGFTDCSKCYVFRGSKEYTTQQIGEQLGLNRAASGRQGGPSGGASAAQGGPVPPVRKFLMPLSESLTCLMCAYNSPFGFGHHSEYAYQGLPIRQVQLMMLCFQCYVSLQIARVQLQIGNEMATRSKAKLGSTLHRWVSRGFSLVETHIYNAFDCTLLGLHSHAVHIMGGPDQCFECRVHRLQSHTSLHYL